MTTRSKRSSSARESLSRKARRRCGEHEHSAEGSPRPAQGQIHRRDELKSGRKERLALHPCDRDDAVLERLAERLERRALELRQLVQEQDASVRETCLARPRPVPPPTIAAVEALWCGAPGTDAA